MTELVDWALAARVGARLAPRGPVLSRADTMEAVAQMRAAAERAVPEVRDVTGLVVEHDAGARVVDRTAWIASNVEGMRIGMGPLLEALQDKEPIALIQDVGARGTALELGAVLAWMSTKVLGQYEVFAEPGRLLLVAPTIVDVERALGVPADDFRLWVALHEETHRVQFGAVPWLRDHLLTLIAEFIEVSDLSLRELLAAVVRAVGALAGRRDSVVEAVQTPKQREVYHRITALMSLLEGHADVVMDAVGPRVVPSVDLIRERFTRRREQPTAMDAVARRALGMDAKLRQYSDGARFVRAVLDARGMPGVNEVWAAPQSLPTLAEIHDPARWLARIRT